VLTARLELKGPLESKAFKGSQARPVRLAHKEFRALLVHRAPKEFKVPAAQLARLARWARLA
jgi:hypothetical protein